MSWQPPTPHQSIAHDFIHWWTNFPTFGHGRRLSLRGSAVNWGAAASPHFLGSLPTDPITYIFRDGSILLTRGTKWRRAYLRNDIRQCVRDATTPFNQLNAAA